MSRYTVVTVGSPSDGLTDSVLAQPLPSGWELDWVLVGFDRFTVPDDRRVRVVEIEDAEQVPTAVLVNRLLFPDPEIEVFRVVGAHDRLLPRALADDLADLDAHDLSWCTSEALDSVAGQPIGRETITRSGRIETGVMLDGWAGAAADVPVHPATAAVRAAVFREQGGYRLGYGAAAEFLARINESEAGVHRARPSMVLADEALWRAADRRPGGFTEIRREHVRTLLADRVQAQAAAVDPQVFVNDPAFWNQVSDSAWSTRYVDEPHTDDFRAMLTQCRKLHFRFDWQTLADLGSQGCARYADTYLAMMVATAHGALGRGWDEAFVVQQQIPDDPKVAHLLLTAVFESGVEDQAVIERAVVVTRGVLDREPGDPVAHYRMTTFHRLLGDKGEARRWAMATNQVLSRLSNAGLADHLSERMIGEKGLISAMVGGAVVSDSADSPTTDTV